jgi:hypothetical protein
MTAGEFAAIVTTAEKTPNSSFSIFSPATKMPESKEEESGGSSHSFVIPSYPLTTGIPPSNTANSMSSNSSLFFGTSEPVASLSANPAFQFNVTGAGTALGDKLVRVAGLYLFISL